MDEFYDLKEYMAVGIRRMKGVMGIIVLVTAFMAFARGGSVYGSQPVGMPMLKGAVWGLMAGVTASSAYVFAVYASDKRILKGADLDGFGIPVIGICRIKGKIGWLDGVLKGLEGNQTCFSDRKELAEYLHRLMVATEPESHKVILTGCVDSAYGAELAACLNGLKDQGNVYQWESSILHSSDTLRWCREENVSVVLIEFFQQSVKKQVQQEIDYFNKMEMDICGIVGIEG